jgi:hypothetical protein
VPNRIAGFFDEQGGRAVWCVRPVPEYPVDLPVPPDLDGPPVKRLDPRQHVFDCFGFMSAPLHHKVEKYQGLLTVVNGSRAKDAADNRASTAASNRSGVALAALIGEEEICHLRSLTSR